MTPKKGLQRPVINPGDFGPGDFGPGEFDAHALERAASVLQGISEITTEKLAQVLYDSGHTVMDWAEVKAISEIVAQYESNGWEVFNAIQHLSKSDVTTGVSLDVLQKAIAELEKALEQITENAEALSEWLEKIKDRIQGLKRCILENLSEEDTEEEEEPEEEEPEEDEETETEDETETE